MNQHLRNIPRIILSALAIVITAGLAGCGNGGTASGNTTPPAATITTLAPATVAVGSAAFTLTVNGSNFVSGALVNFNGSGRTTTFVSATQLTASIPATDVASAGTPSITVTNSFGGPASNALSFTVTAPVNPGPPTLTNLAPSSAIAGSAALTLVVNGSNFVSGAVVNFSGSARNTTFVSATQVTAAISAADVASVGTAPITVTNPFGGGISNALNFTISSPGAPTLTTLSPSTVLAGSAAFTLTVNGSNFFNGATVNVNGTARSTTYVSATQVTAAILATDIANGGSASITVSNPNGGATSNALTLTIVDAHFPTVTALTPVSAMAGSAAFTLTVTGSNFVSGAVVNFNGSTRTTTFVSSTQLTASISAADVASVGTASVSVTNVSVGATSSTLPFTISLTAAYTGVPFTGTVSAGAQAVAGSTVKLFAAGITGNGSTATPLLVGALTTDTTGSFSVPAGYICPTGASQLYVVARGGQLGSAAANSAIAFITSLGACNQVVPASHIVLNEVTTVATAWAFSQFLAPGGNIGATATNTVGIANAAATAASLANPNTGTSPGTTFPSNGVSPAARINTLANLLNTCTSQSSSSTACSTLLSSATGPALQNPDMLDATLRIIHNPAANVAALYTLSITSTAFSPALTKAPADWTLFINYTGGGMDYPNALGIDSTGNVWVASYFSAGATSPSVSSAAKFSPLGVPAFPNGITGSGLSSVYGLAVDSKDNVWITNQASVYPTNGGLGSVTVLNSSGQSISGTAGFIAGGLNYPSAVAIDPDGSAWIVNNGNSRVIRLSSAGTPLSGTAGYDGPSIAFPISIAVDANHNAWVGDQNDGVVNRVSNTGTVTPFNCCSAPDSLAVDPAGNIWIANYSSASVSQISNSGSIVSTGYPGNGNFNGTQGVAVDGSGNVWVGSFHAPVLTELAGASSTNPATGQPISPAAGWAPDAGLYGTYAIAIDPSGNIWVTNLFSNSITQFVGLATPIKTPLIGPPQTP